MLKMSDIATRAGVSPTTVSFVLNDRHEAVRISEKTRKKVLQAAEELGYRSNQLARAMRTGNTRMLGALGGDSSEEPVGKMLAGALEAADNQGYTLKILRFDSMGGSPKQVIRRSSELRLMGVMALHLPPDMLTELHTEARQYGYPLILMDARSETTEVPQVASDDEGGIEAGVEHLVSLGHKKIAFISGEELSSLSKMREDAFIASMKRHGLPVPDYYRARGDYKTHASSVEGARSLLTLPPDRRPTAIFAFGDLIAMATFQVATSLGLQLPRNLSVVGFANMRAAEFANPQLTTIDQPFTEMGRKAVEMLLKVIGPEESGHAHEPKEPLENTRLLLPTRLIVRASTGPPHSDS
jgi:LacI family transcriptional regulator